MPVARSQTPGRLFGCMLMLSFVDIATILMDHLAVQCKKKLETFRIKELKDVLSRIGGRKQGKKQVLVDQIMATFLSTEVGHSIGLKLENLATKNLRSREAVAKIVDDVYRMRHFGAPDLATSLVSTGIGDPSCHSAGQTLLDGRQCFIDSNVRCPCGNKTEFGVMVECDAPNCLARQHGNCVLLPEKEDMKPEIPSNFFCELCRIRNGDPFCVSVAHPLLPIKSFASFVHLPEGGTSVMQSLEKSFILTHHDRQLLQYPEYDLQIWCVLLGDEVAFRMHWPLKADLRVNGDVVRVTNRPGQQKLGANGRDDGALITDYTREGSNRISFTAHDGRSFCLGVRILHRLTVDQVLWQIPREAEGESLDEALARVRRCISGGGAVGDDSDSDLEVMSECVTVNLCCPMSGSRIKVAGRFKPCMHMNCFDLHTFVQLTRRTRKWQCPSCVKNYSLKDLIIDPFFTQIARALVSYDEDMIEVEMKPDGFWRPKVEGDVKLNELWRSPVGLVMSKNLSDFTIAPSSEGFSVEQLPTKIGFESKQDGIWKTVGPVESTTSDMMQGHKNEVAKNGSMSHNSGAMSHNFGASVSRELSSINQEPMDFYLNLGTEEVEVNSSTVNAPVCAYANGFNFSDEHITQSVIVLSDDEDNSIGINVTNGCYGSANRLERQENEGAYFPCEYSGVPQLEEIGRSNVNRAAEFFGVGQRLSNGPLPEENWQFENNVGSSSVLTTAPNAFVDPTVYLLDRSTIMQTCGLNVSQNAFSQQITNDISGTNLSIVAADTSSHGYENICKEVSNELMVSDSSLRELLPHQPARSLPNNGGSEPRDTLTADMQSGWFSLSLGGGDSYKSAANLDEPSDKRTPSDPLMESASLLLELSHYQREDENRSGSKGPEGSTRSSLDPYQRIYCCIDSDSD